MKNLQSKKYDTRLLVAIVIYLFFFPHTRPLEIFLNKRPLSHKLLLLKRLEILIVWECGVCACDHRNVYCLIECVSSWWELLKDTREKESDTKESDTFDERDIIITLL